MFDHEMNYDLDCEISIDSGDVLRVLREQERTRKWAKISKKSLQLRRRVLVRRQRGVRREGRRERRRVGLQASAARRILASSWVRHKGD